MSMERCHSSGCSSPNPSSSIRFRTGGLGNILSDERRSTVLHSPRHGSPNVALHDEEDAVLSGFCHDLRDTIVRSAEVPSAPGHSSLHPAPPEFSYSIRNADPTPEDNDSTAFASVPLSPRPNISVRPASLASTSYIIPPAPTPPPEEGRNSLRSVLTPPFNLFSSKCKSERILKKEPLPPRAWSPVQMPRVSTSSSGSCRSSVSFGSSVFSTGSSILPEKLTQKWPKPRSTKGGSISTRSLSMSMLEKDEIGLGIESVGQWTPHKWCLLFSVTTVFVYGLIGMTCAIATWFRTWPHADVMYVADYDILVLITLAASILLLTSIVGLTGTLLNSRPILAVYALLLWPSLISMLCIGYIGYKRSALSLDRKLNLAWSQWYTPVGRLIIQDSLQCCGYYNALHDATPSIRCYSRTPLPGCKGRLYRFEQENLGVVWSTVFSLVPLHIFNIFVALLCANHVTKRFGKGITPKGYRLTRVDLKLADGRVGRVVVPELSRAPSSMTFREDRAY